MISKKKKQTTESIIENYIVTRKNLAKEISRDYHRVNVHETSPMLSSELTGSCFYLQST